MTHPINTLIELTTMISDLEMVQSWIDNARVACAANQHVQLELDRQQTEVDRKRAKIELLMLSIASQN